MPTSGLVITLNPDAPEAHRTSAAIHDHPSFTCADSPSPIRLPAVLETPHRRADRIAWDWLNALPGVLQVDVVFIHFDQADRPAADAIVAPQAASETDPKTDSKTAPSLHAPAGA
ncbi:MAG: hypothetical protein V3V20_08820 [Algisphaera sp.]